jgi:hypothetical protein
MTHVMLDLERWGTRPGCALRSIGAVVFDPNKYGEPHGPTFYRNVKWRWSDGLVIEESTMKWWREQSAEAQGAFDKNAIALCNSIDDFAVWWRQVGAEFVWCHGANLDAPIYEAAVHAFDCKVPWSCNAVRDTRTLFMLADFDPKSFPFEGEKHNALDDAINQAMCVQLAASKILPHIGAIR